MSDVYGMILRLAENVRCCQREEGRFTRKTGAIASPFLDSLTRSQRRRRIGVQPISSTVAGHRSGTSIDEGKDHGNTQANNDASGLSVTPPNSLLCEARLNDGDDFFV
ncbi:MAG: hypothetical protein WCH39_25480 [Schlesneria sp.]